MLGEKKSFRRFLVVYISSTLLLLAIGVYMYYQMSSQFIANSAVTQMKENINTFIETNQKTHLLKSTTEIDYLDFPIAIYIEKRYKMGNFTLEDIDFSKEVFQKKHTVYYIHNEHKRWGEIYFVTYKEIGKDIQILIQNITIFFMLSVIFIVLIAYILGKIFLKPMKESMELLESFIVDATHEINTPVSNILINIELSKELYPEYANTEECQKIESSAFRISKIFKDLSYIKLNHKEIKHNEDIAVHKVLIDRVDFFQAFIKNKNLSLQSEIQALTISIDKEDLIRIIDNLLSNAIKYAPADTQISIRLSNCLEIINAGEIHNRSEVMKKFTRENSNEGGFGMGLYIVDKISRHYKFNFTLDILASQVHAKICFN